MLCDNAPLTVQQSGHNIVSPKFPAALSFLNLLETHFFLESIYFFSYGFENLEHLSQFKCCAKRVSNCFYCFNGITVNQLKSMTLAMSNRLNLIYARCYSSLSTKLVGCPIRPKSRPLCIQQSGAALWCKTLRKGIE